MAELIKTINANWAVKYIWQHGSEKYNVPTATENL